MAEWLCTRTVFKAPCKGCIVIWPVEPKGCLFGDTTTKNSVPQGAKIWKEISRETFNSLLGKN